MARLADNQGAPGPSPVPGPNPAGLFAEAAVRNDRLVVAAALVLIALLAWSYLLGGAGMSMDTAATDPDRVVPADWTPAYALRVFAMWWITMIATMLPAAAPVVLSFASINRRRRDEDAPYLLTAVFAAGFVLAWGLFSVAATSLHWALDQMGWLTMAMAGASPRLGGALLIAAGIYQFTPLKQDCLRHCRAPHDFIARHWRPGHAGALHMGFLRGVYAVGCCWAAVGLLFYGGVMNLYWIVGLAVLVLLEKLLPLEPLPGNLVGAGIIAWGLLLLV